MKDLFSRLLNARKSLGSDGGASPSKAKASPVPSSPPSASFLKPLQINATQSAGASPAPSRTSMAVDTKLDGIAHIALPSPLSGDSFPLSPGQAPSNGSLPPTPKFGCSGANIGRATAAIRDGIDTSAGSVASEAPKPAGSTSSVGAARSRQASTAGTSQQAGENQADPQEGTVLAISAGCPPMMMRTKWGVKDFELRSCMYDGNISMVYHAIDKKSGTTVALKLYKRYKLTAIERHQVAREIRLHISLNHPSIIGLYAAWKDRSYVYLALEWAPGGDVYQYLRRSSGRLAESVVVPIILEPFLSGMAAIHDMGLIHRDIKPENILINHAFQVKIADFGLAIDSANEQANTRLGTIDYLAPEILEMPVKKTPFDNKENPAIRYTNKVDCWSCGVLAYELLTGQPPFASPSQFETLNLIRTKEIIYPPYLSKEAVSFMQILLVRDPTKRATLREALAHPWIDKYGQRSRRMGANVRMHRANTSALELKSTKSSPGYATPPSLAAKQEGEKDVPTQMANGGQLRGPVEVPNSRSVKALSTVAGSAALLPTSRLASATTKVPLHLPLLVPLGAGSNAEKSAAGNKIPSMTSTP